MSFGAENSSPDDIRRPAVAGLFYPDDPSELRQAVDTYLSAATAPDISPKALVAPHAGYIYSGSVAASAYALLPPMRNRISRVVLLGPSHRVPFRGVALSSARSFSTPLGEIPVDGASVEAIKDLPSVCVLDDAHALEHSLEVHLPFLQTVLDEFVLVPLAVGEIAADEMATLIDMLWGGEETLVVVSSDLSHYHGYDEAQERDARTTDAILGMDAAAIGPESACGCRPLNGLLHLARKKGLRVELLDQCNSGDTAGDRSRVVGYGAYSFT